MKITEVSVKNYLYFEQMSLNLEAGLNAFSGETGAGKSIILSAIAYAFGAKIGSSVQQKEDLAAHIIVTITHLNNNAKALLLSADIDLSHEQDENENNSENAGEVVIRRTISPQNRSKYFINDIAVSQDLVARLGELIIEFTAQGDSSLLKKESYFLKILDNNLPEKLLSDMRKNFEELQAARKQLKSAQESYQDNIRQKDYIEHILNELEVLDFDPKEEEELRQKITFLRSHEQLHKALSSSQAGLEAALDHLLGVDKELSAAGDIFAESYSYLEQAQINLAELDSCLSSLQQKLSEEPQESLNELEDRLYNITSTLKKYRLTADEFIPFMEENRQKLDSILNYSDNLTALEKQAEAQLARYLEVAREVSKRRQIEASEIENKLQDAFAKLKLTHTKIKFEFSQPAEYLSKNGIDKVNTLCQINPGSPYAPIHSSASGGELSRILLALQANYHDDEDKIYIFDEIDTGFSGSVASAVGRNLKEIAKHAQVIIISHQPQVVAFAENHFVVHKNSDEKSKMTTITISRLQQEEQVKEVARMLAGETISSESIAAAEKLIKACA